MKLTKSLSWTIVIAIINGCLLLFQGLQQNQIVPAMDPAYSGVTTLVVGFAVTAALGIKQIIVVYKQAHSNPDGTPASQRYIAQ